MFVGFVLTLILRTWPLLALSLLGVPLIAAIANELQWSESSAAVPMVYVIGVFTICGLYFLSASPPRSSRGGQMRIPNELM
jgi:FtsH-binding integral membrane protein